MRRSLLVVTLATLVSLPASVAAHAPSVIEADAPSPSAAVVLDDPTLSRAMGATIGRPGETDWYRLDLEAGDPLVLGMTAPDAEGSLAATFTLVGPGLPDADASGEEASRLAAAAGVDGAVVFEPAADPQREVHGGLGFIQYGSLRLQAPASGSYYVAVRAVDPAATGKYVFAPGLREEFGPEAVGGMLDLIAFFAAAWEPVPER